MIVRFLSKQGKCVEINTPDTSILIYANKAERKKMEKLAPGECLMMIDNRKSPEEKRAIAEELNTKEIPIRMK